MKRLGDTPLLFDAPLGLVYDLAMDCEIKERGYSKVIMGEFLIRFLLILVQGHEKACDPNL